MRLLGIPPTDSPTFGWVATPAGTILTPVAATITDLTTWASIQGKPAVVAAGVDAAAARGVIGAEATANKGSANGYASLDSAGKVPVTQLPSSIMQYQGVWNASTNTPSLVNGTGDQGDVYRVSVAGSRDFGAGSISFGVGDYAIYNGSQWERSDSTDAVASVNGYTGVVSLVKADVGLGSVDNTADAAKNVLSATRFTTPRTINGVSFDGTANITVVDATKEATANKGAANGYCGLDGTSKVPIANLPTGTTATTVCIGNDARLSDARTPTAHNHTASQVTDFNTAADARVVAGITGKENTITAGTTAQYWRGDKTWQTLNSAAVGLGNVDNTSDATKWAATKTLTNTRVTERVGTTTSSATPSIDCNSFDQYNITALAVAITSVTVTGTPTDGQRLMVRIKDNGTARALAWGASFVSSGSGTLPTTTVANKTHLVGFIYDSAAAKWVCVAADAAGY